MLFAPAKFFQSLEGTGYYDKGEGGRETNEVCVAWITECPLAATTDKEVAKYCQETSCISDQYLPGYIMADTNASITCFGSPDQTTFTCRRRSDNHIFYQS